MNQYFQNGCARAEKEIQNKLQNAGINRQSLERAVKEMQNYLGVLDKAEIRIQQKFYDKVNRAVEKVARENNMDDRSVWDQVNAEARRRGIKTLVPGKDF